MRAHRPRESCRNIEMLADTPPVPHRRHRLRYGPASAPGCMRRRDARGGFRTVPRQAIARSFHLLLTVARTDARHDVRRECGLAGGPEQWIANPESLDWRSPAKSFRSR